MNSRLSEFHKWEEEKTKFLHLSNSRRMVMILISAIKILTVPFGCSFQISMLWAAVVALPFVLPLTSIDFLFLLPRIQKINSCFSNTKILEQLRQKPCLKFLNILKKDNIEGQRGTVAVIKLLVQFLTWPRRWCSLVVEVLDF